MKIDSLEKSILFTLAYFDVFEYPLTYFEIWRYLFCFQSELDEVIRKLDELITRGEIEMKNGFYFLPGKSDLLEKRNEKYEISEKFWRKAIFATKIISYIPFIKMVGIVNSLAFFNCKEDSDIDLFIITEKNKIWTVRFLSTTIMHILGLRRHGKKVAKRICLSFYISEEKMDLSYIAKDELGFFVAFWIAQMAPILNKGKIWEEFRNSNKWIYNYLPNCGQHITNYHTNFRPSWLSKIKSEFASFILKPKIIEGILKGVQIKRIKKSQEKLGNPSSVIYSDEILKFHPVDLRIKYKEELKLRLKNT